MTSSQSRTSTQAPLLLEDPGPINISVTITLTLDPLKPFGGYSRNITHLYSTVMGHQVGLAGECVLKVLKAVFFPWWCLFFHSVRTVSSLSSCYCRGWKCTQTQTLLLQEAANQTLAPVPACMFTPFQREKQEAIVWA